jgi:glucosamine-6-phosphate deaminase
MRKRDWQSAAFLPFGNIDSCLRVAAMSEEEVLKHKNPDLKIFVYETEADFNLAYAEDIFKRIKAARDEKRRFVGIFPVGPFGQYPVLAEILNRERLALYHCHFFTMDEYALEDGSSVPEDFPFGFRNFFINCFIGAVDIELRPPMNQIHVPGKENIREYADMIAGPGGAEIIYGGIGWSGHFAFVDPVAESWGNLDDVKTFAGQGPRFCRLHDVTVLQSSLRAFDSTYPLAPRFAYSIGPAQVRDAGYRSFWLNGAPWQNFIWRLAIHGPVTPRVPASLLQLWPGEAHLLRAVVPMSKNWSEILKYYRGLED